MAGTDVLTLTSALRRAGVEFWITGGWGIDALVGHETRDHQDLDLSIPNSSLVAALELLGDLGFEIVVDWLPTRAALCDDKGHEIDLHPVVFTEDGSAWLPDLDDGRFDFPAASFTTGVINGTVVPCINARLQLTFHLGYEAQEKDVRDVSALVAAGLISPDDASQVRLA